jgi:CRISPR-associated protein Cas1
MFEALIESEGLRAAWARVRADGGAAGGDGETAAVFATDLDARLRRLACDLRAGTYRPGPLRRVPIIRPDGRFRLLRIPSIADRVVQTAANALLGPALDARMSAESFGYRHARSVAQALERLRVLARGRPFALDADIRSFFDSVPHRRLIDELGIWIGDPRMLRLLALWVEGFGGGRGLAQGAPIAPLLANLYLHPLDAAFARAGVPHVRYADDFVALATTRTGAEAARRLAAETLARRGLALHDGKTAVRVLAAGLRFLGQDLAFPGGG